MSYSERVMAALVVFLVLLVCVASTAAIFTFFRYQDQMQLAAKLASDRDEAVRQQQKLESILQFLRERLGYDAALNPDTLRQFVEEDLEQFGRDDVSNDYRSILEYLAQEVADEQRRATGLEKAADELQDHVKTMQPAYEKRVEVFRQARDQAVAERFQEQDRSAKARKLLDEQIAALLDRLETTSMKLRDAYHQREQERDQTTRQVQSLLAAIRTLRAQQSQKLDLVQPGRDEPDGKVTFVNTAQRTVTLDIGSGDGVRAGMTFRVFRQEPTGVVGQEVAALEVYRVERRRSEARITRNDVRVPILVGDLVYNPILRHRQTESFALAGKLDIDGDGEDDSALLRRLIEDQGGRVDLTIDSGGTVRGKLTLNTKCVVMDDKPASSGKDYAELLSTLHREALDHGIPVVSARRFADQLGYSRAQNR